MGVGTPMDLLDFVSLGIDMFDCVTPTRWGRNGALMLAPALLQEERGESDDIATLQPLYMRRPAITKPREKKR